MAHTTLEEVITAARTLPLEDQRRLRQWLEEQDRQIAGQEQQGNADQAANRRAREMRWLEEHEAEYAGQWLALDGDRVLACGADAKQVYAAARAAGIDVPFVVFAEDPKRAQWGGWL
jgi:hypothetical protein